MDNLIGLESLRDIFKLDAVSEILVLSTADGYAIQATIRMEKRTLKTKRGHVRFFNSMDTVAKFLVTDIGCTRFVVDLREYKM